MAAHTTVSRWTFVWGRRPFGNDVRRPASYGGPSGALSLGAVSFAACDPRGLRGLADRVGDQPPGKWEPADAEGPLVRQIFDDK